MKEEIWLPIKGYEGLYEVSNFGNVRRNKKLLKPLNHSRGYSYINLSKDGKVLPFYIHRLVGETFIPNPQNKPTINHINHVKTDNRVENLEWATYKEQTDEIVVRKMSKKVFCVEKNEVYDSMVSAADKNKLSIGNLSMACNGKRKTCGGFHWKYI